MLHALVVVDRLNAGLEQQAQHMHSLIAASVPHPSPTHASPEAGLAPVGSCEQSLADQADGTLDSKAAREPGAGSVGKNHIHEAGSNLQANKRPVGAAVHSEAAKTGPRAPFSGRLRSNSLSLLATSTSDAAEAHVTMPVKGDSVLAHHQKIDLSCSSRPVPSISGIFNVVIEHALLLLQPNRKLQSNISCLPFLHRSRCRGP
jgi:hypothetical protein